MTPEDQAQQKIRELEDQVRNLAKEIEDCHAVLDGARVAMPCDFDRLSPTEQGRALGLVGRITQAVIIWNGCPHKLLLGQQ